MCGGTYSVCVTDIAPRHLRPPMSSHVPPTVFRFLATPFLLRLFSPSRNRKILISSHVLPCPPTVFRFLATPFLLRVFSPSRNRKSPCMSICISLQYYCHPWTHNIILFSHPLVVLDNATRGMPRCARCATGPMLAPVHCTSAARTVRATSTAMRALCAHAHARARACPATKSFPTPQRSCPTERS